MAKIGGAEGGEGTFLGVWTPLQRDYDQVPADLSPAVGACADLCISIVADPDILCVCHLTTPESQPKSPCKAPQNDSPGDSALSNAPFPHPFALCYPFALLGTPLGIRFRTLSSTVRTRSWALLPPPTTGRTGLVAAANPSLHRSQVCASPTPVQPSINLHLDTHIPKHFQRPRDPRILLLLLLLLIIIIATQLPFHHR
jgi:hypothetical protein